MVIVSCFSGEHILSFSLLLEISFVLFNILSFITISIKPSKSQILFSGIISWLSSFFSGFSNNLLMFVLPLSKYLFIFSLSLSSSFILFSVSFFPLFSFSLFLLSISILSIISWLIFFFSFPSFNLLFFISFNSSELSIIPLIGFFSVSPLFIISSSFSLFSFFFLFL